MKLPSIENISNAIRNSISRFPLAILMSVATGAILIMLVYNSDDKPDNTIFRWMVSLAIGFPFMIGIQIAAEQFLERPLNRWIFYLTGLVFILGYFIFLSPDFKVQDLIKPVRFISFFVVVHLFVSLSPFIKGGDVNDFWEYNKSLFVQWFVGALYAGIIYGGLAIALLAVDQLFDVIINYKIYSYLFIILASVFHPIYFTANFPKLIHGISNPESDSRGIKNLVLFILIPLSMLYFLILYLYGLKILVTWNLPKGWVSGLVIGFSIAGTLCYLLNYRLADLIDNTLMRWFKKWFFYILAPLVILLYIAIFRRISDYGITPERYFVLLTGIWLTILSGYFIISGKDNIKWIPGSLIVFLVLGTFSPIDAFRISSFSQMNRLTTFLNKKSALQNNKISIDPKNFKYDDVYQLTTMIRLLEELKVIDKVNNMLKKPVIAKEGESVKTDMIIRELGLDKVYDESSKIYLNYNADPSQKIKLDGFKEMIPINIYKGGIYDNGVQLDKASISLLFKENAKVVDEVSLKPIILELENKYAKQKDKLKLEESSYSLDSKLYNSKLIFTQFSIEKIDSVYEISSLNGFLLLNHK